MKSKKKINKLQLGYAEHQQSYNLRMFGQV